MVPVTSALTPARETSLRNLSSDPEVLKRLEDLHYLVVATFPDCLVQQRGDGQLIYVPPQKQAETTNKNLMTVWLRERALQIKPDDKEPYDPLERPSYVPRMLALYTGWGCDGEVTVSVT